MKDILITKLFLQLSVGLIFTFSSHSFAKVAPLIKCLGLEELHLHKNKHTGPDYKLNQKLINLIAEANDIKVKQSDLKEICHHKSFTPSVSLLKSLTLKGGKIFKLNKENFSQFLRQRSVVMKIEDEIPRIFFKYLSNIQSFMSKPNCLEKEVPNIKYFLQRVKYLESTFTAKEILKEKDRVDQIFTKLQNMDALIKKCQS